MIVLAYLGSQCTKFHTGGLTCWFFMSFHLESCIWPDAIPQWIQQRYSIKFCVISEIVQHRPWQWLDKLLEKKAWAIHRKSKLTETKKGETGEQQSQEHTHHFLWYQGDCSQRILPGRSNSQFYILCENVQRLRSELWRQRNWLMHHRLTFPFPQGIFLSK
jgi:hypothetical protein